MLRTVTIGFLGAVTVLAAAPAAIGYAAAARQQFLVAELSRTVAGTELITDAVDTGWLTSRMRHRVQVTDERLLSLAANLTATTIAAEAVVVFIDSRIAHGPWPLLQGRPGLARMRSTLSVGDTGGPLFELPGAVITDIGFLGGGRTRVDMPAIAQPLPGARGVLRIDGLQATIDFDRDLSRIRSNAILQRVELVSPRGALETGTVQLEGDAHRGGHGLRVGDSRLAVEHFLLTDPLGEVTEAGGLDLGIGARTHQGLLDHTVSLRIDDLTTPRTSGTDVFLEVLTSNLDAAAVADLVDQVRAGGRLDLRQELLRKLIHAGPTLELRDFTLTHTTGAMQLRLQLGIAGDRARAVRSAADLMAVVEGGGRLSVDRSLLAQITGQEPSDSGPADGQVLVTMGFLRPDNGRYSADLEVSGGLVTVNGLPLPLRY